MPSRREFLSSTAIAGLAAIPSFAKQAATRSSSPNDKIQIALIGCGGQGQGDARVSVSTGFTKLVAACDCYDGRLEHMKEQHGRDIFVTKHYEELLTRPDVDAVIIGTPDHWHRKITIDALNAKKDVYCEKPMVQRIEDGHAVIEAQKRANQVLQVGSQRVSSVIYKKAQDLFRSGRIGKLNLVEAWWDRNSAVGAWEYMIPPDASITTCDWPRFQGRAPETAWDPKRFFRWRCYRDYGTGVAGDLFVHLFSGLHFITGAEGPRRVFATGGLRFWNDGRDVPDVLFGTYDYAESPNHPAFNLILRVNFVSGAEENSGFVFTGSDGVMKVDRDVTVSNPPRADEPGFSIDTFSKSQQEAFMVQYREKYPERKAAAATMDRDAQEIYDPPAHYDDLFDHHVNFAMAVRSRKPAIEDAVFGFRAAGPALLSNISCFEKRAIAWDPAAMKVRA